MEFLVAHGSPGKVESLFDTQNDSPFFFFFSLSSERNETHEAGSPFFFWNGGWPWAAKRSRPLFFPPLLPPFLLPCPLAWSSFHCGVQADFSAGPEFCFFTDPRPPPNPFGVAGCGRSLKCRRHFLLFSFLDQDDNYIDAQKPWLPPLFFLPFQFERSYRGGGAPFSPALLLHHARSIPPFFPPHGAKRRVENLNLAGTDSLLLFLLSNEWRAADLAMRFTSIHRTSSPNCLFFPPRASKGLRRPTSPMRIKGHGTFLFFFFPPFSLNSPQRHRPRGSYQGRGGNDSRAPLFFSPPDAPPYPPFSGRARGNQPFFRYDARMGAWFFSFFLFGGLF